jgi:hypothetical protein
MDVGRGSVSRLLAECLAVKAIEVIGFESDFVAGLQARIGRASIAAPYLKLAVGSHPSVDGALFLFGPFELLHSAALEGEFLMDWKKKVLLIGTLLAAAAFVWLQFFGAEQPM